ncbi:MAG: helix-turn-helix transcriptional regulator [Oscillospiraceae bacterium]|nr:helix-turn-helix transcriptional regulator [Oscillospiraceae bacterium]
MDLQKIGTFLKELRKEKELTQEQLAETLNVSRRTVSRWETGSNMPDLDLLVEMADLYQVDLRELLNGERKNEQMNEEMKETVLQVAEYSNAEKQRSTKIVRVYFVLGILALIANALINMMEVGDTFWIGFLKGLTFAMALGAMILGILYTTGAMMKIQAFKMRLIGKEVTK